MKTIDRCIVFELFSLLNNLYRGRLIVVPLCSGQSELASIRLFVQFNNQVDV